MEETHIESDHVRLQKSAGESKRRYEPMPVSGSAFTVGERLLRCLMYRNDANARKIPTPPTPSRANPTAAFPPKRDWLADEATEVVVGEERVEDILGAGEAVASFAAVTVQVAVRVAVINSSEEGDEFKSVKGRVRGVVPR